MGSASSWHRPLAVRNRRRTQHCRTDQRCAEVARCETWRLGPGARSFAARDVDGRRWHWRRSNPTQASSDQGLSACHRVDKQAGCALAATACRLCADIGSSRTRAGVRRDSNASSLPWTRQPRRLGTGPDRRFTSHPGGGKERKEKEASGARHGSCGRRRRAQNAGADA